VPAPGAGRLRITRQLPRKPILRRREKWRRCRSSYEAKLRGAAMPLVARFRIVLGAFALLGLIIGAQPLSAQQPPTVNPQASSGPPTAAWWSSPIGIRRT